MPQASPSWSSRPSCRNLAAQLSWVEQSSAQRKRTSSGRPSAEQLASSSELPSPLLRARSLAARSPSCPPLEGGFHKRDQRLKVHRLAEDLERTLAQGLPPQLVVCRAGDQNHPR